MTNWVIKDVRLGSVAQPVGAASRVEPTPYHAPRLKRTIMGGPGNRSTIVDCTCGARFNEAYVYLGHARRMCDWYAAHVGRAGMGGIVEEALRQYDRALDVIDYPAYARRIGATNRRPPREILEALRVEKSP